MLRDVYPVVQRKYRLPDFAGLDREFELSNIEEEAFPLRLVKARMADVLQDVVDVLHIILQPNTGSLSELCECRCFSEVEKRDAFELFRNLMGLLRGITESAFILDDANDAIVIRQVAKEWPALRKSMVPLVHKMRECWHRTVSSREVLEYLG